MTQPSAKLQPPLLFVWPVAPLASSALCLAVSACVACFVFFFPFESLCNSLPRPTLPSTSQPALRRSLLGLSLSRHAARQELKPLPCVGSEGEVESSGGGSANNNVEQSGIHSAQVLAVMPPPPPPPVSAPSPPRNEAAAQTVWSPRRRLCFIPSTHSVTIDAPQSLHMVFPF